MNTRFVMLPTDVMGWEEGVLYVGRSGQRINSVKTACFLGETAQRLWDENPRHQGVVVNGELYRPINQPLYGGRPHRHYGSRIDP